MFILLANNGFSELFSNFSDFWYLYLILILFILTIFCLLIFKKDGQRNCLSHTQKLVYTALLSAIAFVFNSFITFYPVQYLSISFNATICFISGYILGYKLGFIVGFLGDLLGAIIVPQGPYIPLVGLASGLMGFIPGILFDKVKLNKIFLTVLSTLISIIVCTCIINTLGLYLTYALGQKTFFAYLIVRLPFQLIVGGINCVLSIGVSILLPKILPRDKFYLQ